MSTINTINDINEFISSPLGKKIITKGVSTLKTTFARTPSSQINPMTNPAKYSKAVSRELAKESKIMQKETMKALKNPDVTKATNAAKTASDATQSATVAKNTIVNAAGVTKNAADMTKMGKFLSTGGAQILGGVAATGLNIATDNMFDVNNNATKGMQIASGVGTAASTVGSFFASAASLNPYSALANAAGKFIGTAIGGKHRVMGNGSAAVDMISSGLSFAGPVGLAAAAALQLINGAGIGQRRIMKLNDFSNEIVDPYQGSAGQIAKNIAKYSGRKGGTFDFGTYRRGTKRMQWAGNMQQQALGNVYTGQNMKDSFDPELQNQKNSMLYSGTQPQLAIAAKLGTKLPTLDEARRLLCSFEASKDFKIKLQNGGIIPSTKNLIPEGALHARKHDLESKNSELEGNITKKGIPVVSGLTSNEMSQIAEIERGEIIFNLENTKIIEDFLEKYNQEDVDKDSIAIECGKFLAQQLIKNTKDQTKELL